MAEMAEISGGGGDDKDAPLGIFKPNPFMEGEIRSPWDPLQERLTVGSGCFEFQLGLDW